MISDQALVWVLLGIVVAETGLLIVVICLYVIIGDMRKAINHNFSRVKKDIDTLNARTGHLTSRDPKYTHYIMPEPTQGKDYTR